MASLALIWNPISIFHGQNRISWWRSHREVPLGSSGFLKDRFYYRNSVQMAEWHLFPGLTQGRSWLLMLCEPCFMIINLTQHSSEFYSNSKLLLGKFVLSEVRIIVNFRLFMSYPERNILIALVWFSPPFFFSPPLPPRQILFHSEEV